MRAWVSLGVSAVLVCACGDDATSAADASTGSMNSTGDVPTSAASMTATGGPSSSTNPGDDTSSSGGGSSSDGGFEPTDPVCGNGFVEADEQCDDANDDDDDGCTSACQFQCGLEWSAVQLAPTDQSLLNPLGIAQTGAGGTAVVGFLREITTDQKGNETALDDVAMITMLDEDGRSQWSAALAEDGANVIPAGIGVDDAGDIYVSATVSVFGEDDSDIYVYKLAGGNGDILWTFEHDSAVDSSEDIAFGIEVASDGEPVISGQVRVGDGDDDIWVARLDADAGTAQWESTWSGEPAGGFSTDNGGPIAVGPAGEVYVLAQEYVSFDSQLATLVRFSADGGEAVSTYSPVVAGGQQNYFPVDVSTNSDGDVLVTFIRVLGVGDEYYVARLDGGTEPETWRIGAAPIAEAIADPQTDDYVFIAADFGQDDSVVVSGWLERSAKGAGWVEPWVARLQGDGAVRCQFVQPSPQLSLIPGSLFTRGQDISADDSAVIAAQQVEDGVQAMWVGSFRP